MRSLIYPDPNNYTLWFGLGGTSLKFHVVPGKLYELYNSTNVAFIILNARPSSYGPFDIAFRIPRCTDLNLFLSNMMSWGISIFISIFNNTSLVLTNNHKLQLIFKNVNVLQTNLNNWIWFIEINWDINLTRTMESQWNSKKE